MVIEVATIDEDSEEELEDVETPHQARQKRWERVAQAAVKQCLRFATPVTSCTSSITHFVLQTVPKICDRA